MNKFDEYASWTDTTAKYPVTAPQGYCSEPSYLALGIADECGELAACPDSEEVKEAGDVMWYCARYAVKVLGIPFSEVVSEAQQRQFYGDVSEQIGAICGVEKKRIRDGHLWTPEVLAEKQGKAYNALVCVVGYVLNILSGEYTLEHVVDVNMGKLNARLDAGTIQGDGDHR